MIRLVSGGPRITGVALSGGPDSMALLSFIGAHQNITAFYFDHGTKHGQEAKQFVSDYCHAKGISLVVGQIANSKTSDLSWEEYWRNERYAFLNAQIDQTIATAHHLNDVAETYLWGCIHGKPKFINYQIKNIVRPFLLTPKTELLSWCNRKQVPYIIDPSNEDTKYTRNRIRQNILPQVDFVNPGFLTVVKKLWLANHQPTT